MEGLAHHHVREVLGLTSISASYKAIVPLAFHHPFITESDADSLNDKQKKHVSQIHTLLSLSIYGRDDAEIERELMVVMKKIQNRSLAALKFVCKDVLVACPPPDWPEGKPIVKSDLAKLLIKWVSDDHCFVAFSNQYNAAKDHAIAIRRT
jgi:hypothetical protein